MAKQSTTETFLPPDVPLPTPPTSVSNMSSSTPSIEGQPSQRSFTSPNDTRALDSRRRKARFLQTLHFTDDELFNGLYLMCNDSESQGLEDHPDFVRKFIPEIFEDSYVPYRNAVAILAGELESHMARRVANYSENKDSEITSVSSRRLDTNERQIIIKWRGKQPKIPSKFTAVKNLILKEGPDPKNFRYESATIKFGNQIYPDDEVRFLDPVAGRFGTVGSFMTLDPCHHIIVTAGHVVGDDADSALIRSPADTEFTCLRTLEACNRTLGVPQMRQKWTIPRKCFEEMCFLSAEALDETQISCSLCLPVDCNAFLSGSGSDFPLIPHAEDPELLMDFIHQNAPFKVFKNGAQSGLTSGLLISMERLDKGFEQSLQGSPNESDSEKDMTRAYQLEIKWLDHDHPFATPGDSGSLVFAVYEGRSLVPLGIHCYADLDSQTSYSYLLASWTQELSFHLDREILFCDPDTCKHDTTAYYVPEEN